jgi:dolichyl-phosphate beta-glucosyltransferase
LTREMPDRVRILSYALNRGKGYAVRRGLQAARGSWRIFTDVDLAYGFDDVLRLARALRAGSDIAIASRTHTDSRLILPPQLQGYAYRRHLQSLLFSALVRGLLPLKERDTQAGLKGLSAQAVSLVLPCLHCDGFGFDCELLIAGLSQGLRITEVPVTLRLESSTSTTSLWSTARIIRELWAIRRAWRYGRLAKPIAPALRQQRHAA